MPDWKPALDARLASLRLTPTRAREIVDELSQHLDDTYEELRSGGASHDAAMRTALAELDEGDRLAREMRTLRQASMPLAVTPGSPRGTWFQDLTLDLRYATRLLLHTRGWTAVVVLLLALGIGANTALFSASDAMLFSSLPVKDPAALVRLRWTGKNDMVTEMDEYGFNRRASNGEPVHSSLSFAIYQLLAADARDKAALFACAPFEQVNLVIDDHAELAEALGATGNYFDVLGISAREGRVFTEADDRATASPVAVISSRFWQARFGADPAVVGKVIKANDVPVTIVGILPGSFTGVKTTLADPPDISFPLSLDRQIRASTGRSDPSYLTQPTAWWLQVMGRLRPGVTAAQLQAALDGEFTRTARATFDAFLKSVPDAERGSASFRNRHEIPRLMVDSGQRGVYDVDGNAITSAVVLSAVVAVILLIVCANVANLMLSRMVARRREMSVRLSLGASRPRLVRQLLTEALLLAFGGAGLGLVVAWLGVQILPPPVSTVGVFHPRVIAFTAFATILTAIVFGAAPALRGTRVDVNSTLKETGRSVVAGRSLLARTLLVSQVALSLMLLVGAGLFLRTLTNLRHVDVGFNPQNLLLVRIAPRVSGYDQPRTLELYRTLLDRLAALPGVRGAALSQPALLSGSVSSTGIFVEGRTYAKDARDVPDSNSINRLVVSPEFFRVIGVPIVMGRALTEHDDRSSPRVTVINEAAARMYFPNENPIGRRFGSSPDKTGAIEVVGVVRDAKYSTVRESPPPTMYDSYLQSPRAAAALEVRTDVAPSSITAAVRGAIHDVDPNLPIVQLSTQLDQIERRFGQEKLFAQAYTLFGGIALFLASIGLFGLMSYNVARRTAEMGIRMALGAQRASVLTMIMRESMQLVLIGVVAGVALAIGAGGLVASLLFGLGSRDMPTIVTASLVLVAVSALAAYLPARRASLVDPMVALRYE